MAVQEIRSTDWKEFCSRFERFHRGDLMTLIHLHVSGYKEEKVRGLPLQTIRFDPSGDCSNRIMITLGQEGTREIQHEIIEPIHDKVREEQEGSKGLQIDAENGTTILTFSSGRLNELLEGLAQV